MRQRLLHFITLKAITKISPTSLIESHTATVDVLWPSFLELDLFPVIETRDTTDGPEQVVDHGGLPSLTTEAELKVIVRADIVVLKKRDQLGSITVNPVPSQLLTNTGEIPAQNIVTKRREQGKIQHGKT